MFQKLKNLIEKLPEVHALVIGDVMLDKFMYGVVERISPEAPVPIFKSLSEKICFGWCRKCCGQFICLKLFSPLNGGNWER